MSPDLLCSRNDCPKNIAEFTSFLNKRTHCSGIRYAGFRYESEPVTSFAHLFQGDGIFADEISPVLAGLSLFHIRSYRSSGSKEQ